MAQSETKQTIVFVGFFGKKENIPCKNTKKRLKPKTLDLR